MLVYFGMMSLQVTAQMAGTMPVIGEMCHSKDSTNLLNKTVPGVCPAV